MQVLAKSGCSYEDNGLRFRLQILSIVKENRLITKVRLEAKKAKK